MKTASIWIIGVPVVLAILPFLSDTLAALGWMSAFFLMIFTLFRPFKADNMPGRKTAIASIITLLFPLIVIGSMIEPTENVSDPKETTVATSPPGKTDDSIAVAKIETPSKPAPINQPSIPASLKKAMSGSDNYLAHQGLFLHAAAKLIDDFSCTERHLADYGGFIRSASVDNRYFTYCGNYDRIDITLLSHGKYTIQKKGKRGKKRYRFEGQSRGGAADIKSKIAKLEERVQPIPASDFSANLDIYKQLLALDPTNERYRKKVAQYEAIDKADEARIMGEIAPIEAIQSSTVCKDKVTDWLTHNVAKKAIKSSLKSPRSAKFSDYRTQFVEAKGGQCIYVVAVNVDAQNSFGAMIRERMNVAVSIDPVSSIGVGAIIQ